MTHSLSSFTLEGYSLEQPTHLFQPVVRFSLLNSLSLFLDLLLLLLLVLHQKVPSCRPPKTLRLYLPLTLAPDRTITEPHYQTSHTRFTPIHIVFVLGLRHHSATPSVRLFFIVFCHRLTPFALRKPRVMRCHPPLLSPPLLPPMKKLVILY